MKRFGICLCALMMVIGLTGCGDDKSELETKPRDAQEAAFRGDPSKAPDSVKQMMQNPPTANSQPAQPPQ